MQLPVKVPQMSTARNEAEFAESIASPVARLGYVVDRVAPFLGYPSYFYGPMSRNAGELLGRPTRRARKLVEMVRARGGAKPYLDFVSKFAPFTPPTLAADAVRYVYVASVVSEPHIIKIGFSADLTRRMKQLKAETGREHVVISSWPGTGLDEAFAHLVNESRHISREWFFATDAKCREYPTWLPSGPREIFEQIRKKRPALAA